MNERDPELFKKYNYSDAKTRYSRVCPANQNRLPIALTEDEKKKIDTVSPGSYGYNETLGKDNSMEYSSCLLYTSDAADE